MRYSIRYLYIYIHIKDIYTYIYTNKMGKYIFLEAKTPKQYSLNDYPGCLNSFL